MNNLNDLLHVAVCTAFRMFNSSHLLYSRGCGYTECK